MTTDRRRRRHAATGARIVAGSLSAAATLTLMSAMASSGAEAPTTGVASSGTKLVVGPASAPLVTGPIGSDLPRVVRSVGAPVATSRGS